MTPIASPPTIQPESQLLTTCESSSPPCASFSVRLVTVSFVVLPFLGLIGGAYLCWGGVFGWVPLGLLIGMYLITALGITVGFHRLFTHRSFEAHWSVKSALAIFGCMAIEGSVLRWVADHRKHHRDSDQPGDPHSPHLLGSGLWGVVRGMFHSHLGWLFQAKEANWESYVPDLIKCRITRSISRLFPLWVALGLLIPVALGWILTGSWTGGVLGLIWGGLIRVFFVHHVTWSINSICHLWGSQPFQTGDHSRNNFIFGVLAMGEGWHNNHHAFPTSARHGLRWWQIDLSYAVIRSLELVGLVWNVKLPPQRLLLTHKKSD